jgi:hypothetical protein
MVLSPTSFEPTESIETIRLGELCELCERCGKNGCKIRDGVGLGVSRNERESG